MIYFDSKVLDNFHQHHSQAMASWHGPLLSRIWDIFSFGIDEDGGHLNVKRMCFKNASPFSCISVKGNRVSQGFE
jgi:hypothetical protein